MQPLKSLHKNLMLVLLQCVLTLSLVSASLFGVNLAGARTAATTSATVVEASTSSQAATTTTLASTTALPDVASVASLVRPATVLVLNLGAGGTAQAAGTGFIIDVDRRDRDQ